MFRKIHQVGRRRSSAFGKLNRGAVFVIAGQFFERQGPTVALVCHKTLKHRQRIRARHPSQRTRLHRQTAERRRNGFLRQVLSNFAIRIRPWLLPAEEFQDQAVAVNHGGITLLRGAAPCSQGHIFWTAHRLKLRAWHTSNRSISCLSLLPVFYE